MEARAAFAATCAALPDPNIDHSVRAGYQSIVPPTNFSLHENYGETLSFILGLRRLYSSYSRDRRNDRVRIFADFSKIESIEPAAGLVLAAEVDRWRLASGKKMRAFEKDWHPEVKLYFAQAGLFDLFSLKIPDVRPIEGAVTETLKFSRGRSVHGQTGSKIRDQLEALCGKSIGPKRKVYDAIAEAIANTRHAYPTAIPFWPIRLTGYWWASGSWSRTDNVVSIQLYDQGVGIPATLPKSEHWSAVLNLIGVDLNPERHDDRLLEAALAIGRTSTGEKGRGNGLAEMAAWIDNRRAGFLRITSGGGTITYRQGGNITRERRSADFPGTLIEWETSLDE